MKYSIDFNYAEKFISGWVVSDDNLDISNVFIELRRKGVLMSSSQLNIQRDDVRIAELHPTGACGFKFDLKKINVVLGFIYEVKIITPEKVVSKNILNGDPVNIHKEYTLFEIERGDFSILDVEVDDLAEKYNDIIFFKIIIIRLRRGKRANNWRHSFNGKSYKFIEQDWFIFDEFVKNNISIILSVFSVRDLISIVDTYADYAKSGERHAALSVSNIVFQEQFAQTFRCVYDFVEKNNVINAYPIPVWDGVKTNCLAADDAYDIFLTRNLECLKEFPIIESIFVHIIKKMMLEENSVFGVNIKFSHYFQDLVSFYRNIWHF